MATGRNPNQSTCYLEASSGAWLAVYKGPRSTELIKPTSIAFPVSAKDFWIELTQDQSPLQSFRELCTTAPAMFERGHQPLGLSYLNIVIKENHSRTAAWKKSLLPTPRSHI